MLPTKLQFLGLRGFRAEDKNVRRKRRRGKCGREQEMGEGLRVGKGEGFGVEKGKAKGGGKRGG
jgi:hypothetical protein